jgi:predicted house-cleaning noncanonical NTP pyrophosphatase (MazG superfamily)
MSGYNPNAKYNKLVRDNIPSIIANDNLAVYTRVLDDGEYLTELKKKLIEEATEVSLAESSEELLKELADVKEVFNSIANAVGVNPRDIENERSKRASARGGFTKRIFLIETKEKK